MNIQGKAERKRKRKKKEGKYDNLGRHLNANDSLCHEQNKRFYSGYIYELNSWLYVFLVPLTLIYNVSEKMSNS